MFHRQLPLRRLILRLSVILLSLAAPRSAAAQVVDDTDADITNSLWASWGNVRCLRLAASREEVVAAFVHQVVPGTNTDYLVVVISKDRGRTWTTLYHHLIDSMYTKDMAIVVADGYAGHPQDRWIYILQEIARPNPWNLATWQRFMLLVDGPLDRPWSRGGNPPHLTAVRRTVDADPSRLEEPLHPALTIAPYAAGAQYMVLVGYRWIDDGDNRIEVAAPLPGARGSGFGPRGRVVAGPGGAHEGGTYDHPSISADPEGRWIALAFEDEDAGTSLVTLADAETFRQGRAGFAPEFETDPRLGLRYAPHVGVHDNAMVMTTLGPSDPRYPGTASLHWYVKDGLNAFQARGLLHDHATSSAPVDYSRGIVYAVAHTAPDPAGGMNPGVATVFSGFARRPTLTVTTVGDHLTYTGTPAVCVLEEGLDRAIFGYTEHDVWNASFLQALWVDPGN